MNKNRKLINAFLVSSMMLSGLSLDVSAAEAGTVTRLGGTNRVDTSIVVSDTAYTAGSKTVVLAGWNGEVDALTGTLLAAAKDAPLLIVEKGNLAKVKDQITKLGATEVLLLGGSAAISDEIKDDLEATFTNVRRVSGAGRYETAAAVAKEVNGGKADHVFITSDGLGGALADALTAGPASGLKKMPILITGKDSVHPSTLQAIKDLGATKATIVGGSGVVSEAVKTELEKANLTVDRKSGKDRFLTATAVADEYFAESTSAIIANFGAGEVYADALVGGYLGAKTNAPILLTPAGSLQTTTQNYLGGKAMSAYVLGGTAAVSDVAFKDIEKIVKENNVEEDLTVESVSAINADELEVTFNQAADVDNVELAVTQGKNKVSGKFTWNADNTVATFKADGKLRAGDYTVTATSGDKVTTGTVKVADQKIDEIVILDGEALTSSDRKEAYAFYDVVDQYGESVRATTNITWTASTGAKVKADRTTGQLTLGKGAATEEFRYKEVVYLTGVDAKTGKSVQGELTIGQPRALDTLEIAGFVKKGSSDIVEELPAGFKSGEYSMVFEALDQNGNVYYDDNLGKDDVTFVSDNPLLIEKVSEGISKLVIDGVDYGAVEITPGMNVDQGGEVNITAIANKTGNRTTKNIVVGDVEILSDFNMLEPAGIIAEGEEVEIPFEAKAGNKTITNFTTLARKAGINELKLNKPTVGNLVLEENNDGTARLMYKPDSSKTAWTNSETTDGIDRPVPLTAVVIGGNASSLMLSVEDKARPVGIKEVNFDDTVVEEGSTTIALSGDETDSFTFVDQYGREMFKGNAYAFFDAAEKGEFKSGQELQGYKYSIKATYKGEDDIFESTGDIKNNVAFEIKVGEDLTLTANADVTQTAKSNMALDFEIIRYKHDATVDFADPDFDFTPVSSKKNAPMTVVDITAVKNFEVKEMDKLEVKTDYSEYATGATAGLDAKKLNDAIDAGSALAKETHTEVTGDYNGRSVNIPADYVQFDSDKLIVDADNGKLTGFTEFSAGTNGTVTPAVAATATIGGVEFEAVEAGEAGNNISVEIVQGDAATAADAETAQEIEVNDKAIKITLGTEWDTTASKNLTMDTDALKDLIKASNDAKSLVKVTNTTSENVAVTVNAEQLLGGEAEVPGVATPGQDGFKWGDFYDATTANFLRKDAEATITAKVYNTTATKNDTTLINTANRTVTLSDAQAVATTIKGADENTVRPTITNIEKADLLSIGNGKSYVVLDQYGEEITADIALKAINVVENKDGYVANNFKVIKNDTTDLGISGAERGDTFTLELRSGNAKKTVKVTVGADTKANVTNGKNNYLDELIGNKTSGGLEQQRVDSLN